VTIKGIEGKHWGAATWNKGMKPTVSYFPKTHQLFLWRRYRFYREIKHQLVEYRGFSDME
jgi:hypothetical protein